MIYLCRHGQTELNLARRYQGHMDSPLTPLGEAQARRMGERLASLIPDPETWILVTSPLGRARRTAEIIQGVLGRTGALHLEPRIAEVSMGEWDGLHVDELAARRPAHVRYPERYFQGPGGETLEVFTARLADWLGSIPADAKVIAVSHGVAGRVLRGLYAGLPREEMLTAEVPQDAVFHLSAGRIMRIECEPVG